MSTVEASDSSSTELILGHRLGDRDGQSHSDDALVKRTAISTREDNRSSVSYQIGRTNLPSGKTVTIEKIPKANTTHRWLRRMPVFVVISIIQVVLFYTMTAPHSADPTVVELVLQSDKRSLRFYTYRDDKRFEPWRFFTYAFLHHSDWHLWLNVVVQVLVGTSLEWTYGFVAATTIYACGVVCGSLVASIVHNPAVLVGASGGVYALLAAYAVHAVLHREHILWGAAKAVMILCAVATEWSLALYYASIRKTPSVVYVSYASHVTGVVCGLILALHFIGDGCFPPKSRMRLATLTAKYVLLVSMFLGIIFNLIYGMLEPMRCPS